MNQRFWKHLTLGLLTTTTLGLTTTRLGLTQATILETEQESVINQTDLPQSQPQSEAIKVGTYRSQTEAEEESPVIATIYSHPWNEVAAATLYVQNIPVLTFIGNLQETTRVNSSQGLKNISPSLEQEATLTQDAVWRATSIAAKLNQLNREDLDAQSISVHWNIDKAAYEIKVGDEPLVTLDENTVLPDTTKNPAEDALQATNRLRRLIGNAPPLRDIIGRPIALSNFLKPPKVVQKQLQSLGRGMASWYGPGFHGRRSASGERFNQNALTAAHRTLPFGTKVKVTNLNNGQSVVVRINDRGPYAHGRVIDLSAAAARMVGMIQSGVAPVHLEAVSE